MKQDWEMQFVGFDLLRAVPPLTFNAFVVSFLLSLAATLQVLQPQFLTLDLQRAIQAREIHRLLTGFLFFGPLSLNYLIFCIQNLQTVAKLESSMSGQKRLLMALLGFVYLAILLASGFMRIPYACLPFFTALQCIYCVKNPEMLYQLYGILVVKSKWLPLVHLAIAVGTGQGVMMELLGNAIGVCWYALEDLLPRRHNRDLLQSFRK